MRVVLVAMLIVPVVQGCAGLDISTLKPSDVTEARTVKPLDGYIVYEPMVVVEVSVKDVCLAGKDDKGSCKAPAVVQCAASTPFLLPDYNRPYLVRTRNGFGKAGVEVAITDGWRLGTIKDNSDNTAVLGTIEKAFGLKSVVPDSSDKKCAAPGLYRVSTDPATKPLVPLTLY